MPPMGAAVSTDALTKTFGKVLAVDRLSLEVGRGEIYGFLGLNGAGKTTTIRMLLGMIKPTSGFASMLGLRANAAARELWSRVGYLVESASAYPQLTVRENLEVTRRLKLVKDPGSVDRVMETLALGVYSGRKAQTLSTGNMQRLGLARAILGEPDLILLDEPANGLDPAGVVEVRELLKSLARERGATVFMSSHILGEVARLATRIGIINEGRLIEELDSDELEGRLQPRLAVDARDRAGLRQVFHSAGMRFEDGPGGELLLAEARAVDRPDDIARLLFDSGFPPTLLHVRHEDLETHFLKMVGHPALRDEADRERHEGTAQEASTDAPGEAGRA